MQDLILGNLFPWQSHHVNREYSPHCRGLSLQRSPHEVITEQLIITRQTAANKPQTEKNVLKSGGGGPEKDHQMMRCIYFYFYFYSLFCIKSKFLLVRALGLYTCCL